MTTMMMRVVTGVARALLGASGRAGWDGGPLAQWQDQVKQGYGAHARTL